MTDRFDLEQGIIGAWGIVDDLKECRNMDEVNAVQQYYSMKFDRLWETFEELLANYKLVRVEQPPTDTV